MRGPRGRWPRAAGCCSQPAGRLLLEGQRVPRQLLDPLVRRQLLSDPGLRARDPFPPATWLADASPP
eukprot:8594979-Pyramimonas_sp.AAC.1